MWPKPKKKGKTKNKLDAVEKIPDGPEQIELLRKGNSTSTSGVHQGRDPEQPREDISGVWKASLMKAIAPGSAPPGGVQSEVTAKMKIPVNRDVLEAQEKQKRQFIFQSVIKIIDRMFDNFHNTAYGFNQVASGSDLELTWMRPQVREENMAAWHEGRTRLAQIFSGRISTRFWTMLVRGTDEGLGAYIMPADKVLSFTPEDRNFLCYLNMTPVLDDTRNTITFTANGLPVSEDLYPSIFRALLDALIRYANEEATPGEVFDFVEIGIVPEAPPPPKEISQAPVVSSFNAEVPRQNYQDAVQQIQAHNRAGHVDQHISTSTNARPVYVPGDPAFADQFQTGQRMNSGNFPVNPNNQPQAPKPQSSDDWKGFGSATGSHQTAQSQSDNWRQAPGPAPANEAPSQPLKSETGNWNFIPKADIQAHQNQGVSGSNPIVSPQPQPQPQQIPPQMFSHPTADSGIISEFTMPDFKGPTRQELDQINREASSSREFDRPSALSHPVSQNQEMAGVTPAFNPAAAHESQSQIPQIREEQQFELLSENLPEASGEFAPIEVANEQSESGVEHDEFDAIEDNSEFDAPQVVEEEAAIEEDVSVEEEVASEEEAAVEEEAPIEEEVSLEDEAVVEEEVSVEEEAAVEEESVVEDEALDDDSAEEEIAQEIEELGEDSDLQESESQKEEAAIEDETSVEEESEAESEEEEAAVEEEVLVEEEAEAEEESESESEEEEAAVEEEVLAKEESETDEESEIALDSEEDTQETEVSDSSSESSNDSGLVDAISTGKVHTPKVQLEHAIEITLGKCPDLSDALMVLLPVLDAQIDELATQGGKAFASKDFKKAEAIIKLSEKLEEFKNEASEILGLIDKEEDDDD